MAGIFQRGGGGNTQFHTMGTYLIGISTFTPCFIDLATSRAQNLSRERELATRRGNEKNENDIFWDEQ